MKQVMTIQIKIVAMIRDYQQRGKSQFEHRLVRIPITAGTQLFSTLGPVFRAPQVKHVLTFILLFVSVGLTFSQEPSEPLPEGSGTVMMPEDQFLQTVEEHNPSLKVAREVLNASQLESRTGLAPGDPSVELGYMNGTPEDIGNKVNVRVAQEFEFPTVYLHRSKAGRLKAEGAKLRYEAARQEVLVRAVKLRTMRVYLNRLEQMLGDRLKRAEELLLHYEQMTEAGETGQLSLSQVNMLAVSLRTELVQVESDLQENREAMLEISGGVVAEVEDEQFPEWELPGREELFEAYGQGPEMQYFEQERLLRERQSKVAVGEALPKFAAGYYSEILMGEGFRGVFVGFSVPLWENSNKVKHARAEVAVAEAEVYRYQGVQQMELEQQMIRRERLERQVEELSGALSRVDDEALLTASLQAGEISLSEYLYGTEMYFRNKQKLLEYERDLQLVEAELMRVYY
jgi:outer membrane protein, heavy metal efflux system